MKIEDFQAGKWLKQYQYKSFSPSFINQEWTWDHARINTLLESATRAIGELNAYSLLVPNVDLFIHMHIVKEANTSSRIEGTQTQIDEAVAPAEMVAPERRNDWEEVQNYVQAMNEAIKQLEEMPLSTRLLCQTHATLMKGVRGEEKMPGEFRRSQNWIGGAGPSDAVFVPPHQNEVVELMSDLEKFLHNDEIHVPDLIRIALAHYQFETIHPFCDGNGRIGRLMITLYLCIKRILQKPTLYLSAHLEKHKGSYYDALTMVRHSNDLAHWIRFFLNAVRETAESSRTTFESIVKLRSEVEEKILGLGKRAENARQLLNHLYQRPVVTPNQVAELLVVSHPTASSLVQSFEELGILKPSFKIERSQAYAFKRYIHLYAS
jgi:Fic family protein